MNNYTIITDSENQEKLLNKITIDLKHKNGKLEINVNSDIDLNRQKEIFNIINSLV